MKTIKIGDWEFDHSFYDRDADVLYLSIGEPHAAYGEDTPEGHILRFDANDNFCGLTLVGIREIYDSGETPTVTLPSRTLIPSQDLELALC